MTHASDSRLPTWLPGVMLSLLRAMTGALFMQHGVQKLFGLLTDPARPWMGAPAPFSLFWIAGILEVGGGGPFSADAMLRGRRGAGR